MTARTDERVLLKFPPGPVSSTDYHWTVTHRTTFQLKTQLLCIVHTWVCKHNMYQDLMHTSCDAFLCSQQHIWPIRQVMSSFIRLLLHHLIQEWRTGSHAGLIVPGISTQRTCKAEVAKPAAFIGTSTASLPSIMMHGLKRRNHSCGS